jgi:hypothetical protein
MKTRCLYILLFSLIVSACKKEEIKEPEFEVTTESKTYAVNEDVRFDFKGDPDLISFYSGEVLHDYDFAEGRLVKGGVLKMSFQSNVQFGAQANQLSVLASTDFNGKYNFAEGINLATWTDITSQFSYGNSATFRASGEVDISNLRVENKPLFIAFKYNVKNQAATSAGGFGVGRTWRIQNLLITSETSLGILPLGDVVTSGFQLVDLKPALAPMRSTMTSTYLNLVAHAVSGASAHLTTVETENWAISKPLEVGDVDLGPDRPVPIKGVENADVASYTHVYTKPGTYKVYFIASNADVYGSSRVVKELEIIITP